MTETGPRNAAGWRNSRRRTIASHYREMAEHYLTLATVEERIANGGRPATEPGTPGEPEG